MKVSGLGVLQGVYVRDRTRGRDLGRDSMGRSPPKFEVEG